MIVFCAILLLIHQGSALAPVTTVQLGESVTLGCVLPSNEIDIEHFYWFKQSAGGNLKLIVSQQKFTTPVYASDISASRLRLTADTNISNLTILRTIQEDEGMYHCGVLDWIKTSWSGTFLLITGNDQRTSSYSVVQGPTVSDPVHPGDSVTLQCSVLSDSDNKMCTGDHRVFWFRVGSHKSHHSVIYTDGGTHEECDEISDTQKRCFYRFSENVSSSDVETYYCAVATCGEILFGHGTKVEIDQTAPSSESIPLVVAIVCLVISVAGNIVFMCYRSSGAPCKQFKGSEKASPPASRDSVQPVHDITDNGDELNYAGLYFSGRKGTRGGKKKELTEESVYSQVRF